MLNYDQRDASGHFGPYGGTFVAETLIHALHDLEAAYAKYREDAEFVAEFRHDASEQLLVGIDRLDYTKGIPRRLLAYERMLADHPELHGRVRLVQVAVPSRTNVDAYAELVQALKDREPELSRTALQECYTLWRREASKVSMLLLAE